MTTLSANRSVAAAGSPAVTDDVNVIAERSMTTPSLAA
jgi:hypothetical protein